MCKKRKPNLQQIHSGLSNEYIDRITPKYYSWNINHYRNCHKSSSTNDIKAKESFLIIEEEGQNVVLEINEGKTKYMHATRNPLTDRISQSITMDNYNFENSEKRPYQRIKRKLLKKIYGLYKTQLPDNTA